MIRDDPVRSSRRRPVKRRVCGGFVLVATLWVLLAMSLFISYFSVLVADSQEQALQLKQQLQARLDQQATLATLLYLVSTRPMSYAGLRTEPYTVDSNYNPFDGPDPFLPSSKEIRLDGRWYRGIGQATFRLQDAGSLISLRGENFTRLKKLLALNQIDKNQQERLIANLIDYSDRDSLVNLNGAEFRQYKNEGMLPPANRFLVSPMQLLNVLDWGSYLGEPRIVSMLSEISIYVANRENFNTMTRLGMATIGFDGIDSGAIDKILSDRKSNSFSDVGQINQLTGSLIPLDPFASPLFPSKYLRVSLNRVGQRQEEWLGITLTPASAIAPWQIDYRFMLDTRLVQSKNEATDNLEHTASPLFL